HKTRREAAKMRVFKGSAIALMLALISLAIFILYNSMASRSAAEADSVIAGAVLFSLALTLPYYITSPTIKRKGRNKKAAPRPWVLLLQRSAAPSSFFMREINRASWALWKFSAITLAILGGPTGRIGGRTGIPAGTTT